MSWPRLAVGAPSSPVEPSSFLFMFFVGIVPCFPLLWACTRHDASVATGSPPAVVTGLGAACLRLRPPPSQPLGSGGHFGFCEGLFPLFTPLAV